MQANRGEQANPDEPSVAELLIDVYYQENSLDNVLAAYADRKIAEDEAGQSVRTFASHVGRLAYASEEDIDVDLVRQGFERLSSGMDQIIHERLEPPGLKKKLFKFNKSDQPPPRYIRRLDD